ncbi:FAD-binding oxidoreductase [Nocardiopsis metallicus]|uniref:FAD/FMN-containing dehydrogenase n=1 Tax=Nocardiopsis metallicus TaxID=179819 RepID=A0A840WDW4_9ACTN|nr:FAD-binding oxidoreductase [Nocardiopsis metallicus]MBB5491191.1 FAD/FMN-containing dehydrogenase [Nocardiopsis metallicus]
MSENKEQTTEQTHLLDRLRARVRGPVHAPGSPGHERARSGVQRVDRHAPDAVVEASDAEDVRAAVAVAAELGLPVAAQRTGHGHGTGLRGGVLVDTRRLDRVRIDPGHRTAAVGAGATWQDVIDAAVPHGLSPLSGSSPGVGAVSYTLGGGLSLMGRRYGYAADHVRSLDLVTADGRLRRADAHSEPDLFWALRGGGSSFGLVTEMELALFPVSRLYGGSLYLDATDTPRALDGWRRWAEGTPDELTSGVSAVVYPDMEGVPEPMRGRLIVQVSLAWSGPPEKGPALAEPLYSLAPVLMDTLRELPYTESGAVFDDHDDPAGFRGEGLLVDSLPSEALAELQKLAAADRPFMSVVWLRHLGGALARPPEVPDAVGHRDAAYALSVLTFTEPDTDRARALRAEAAALFADHTRGRSSNLSFGAVAEDEVRAMFAPDTLRRLARIRDRVDPNRRIHTNRPIAAPGTGTA